jgi:general secretion pathway protein N
VRYFRPPAAFILLFFLSASAFSTAATSEEKEQSAVALANPVAAQPLDQLSTILDRPLFSPSRRPPAPPPPPVAQAPAPPAPPPPPPDLVLFGVVMDGEGARAVVRAGADKKILRAQIGDDIGGWKVSQIEGRKVVLSLDGRFATFTLFSDDRGKSDSAPASGVSGEPRNSQRQIQAQQTSPQAAAPQSGQPRKRRRARE